MTLGQQTEDSPILGVSKAHQSRQNIQPLLHSSFPLYMLILKCFMPFKNPEQAEGGLEMK